MQAFDIQFIEKADGPKLVEGLERMARVFKFDLSELRKNAGFSESTFNRWLNSKRRPSHNSRMKIKFGLNSVLGNMLADQAKS